MELIRRYFLVFIIVFSGLFAKGTNNSGFGIDPNQFREQNKNVIAMLKELVKHYLDGDITFENKLGEFNILSNRKDLQNRIIIHNYEDAKYIYFLGYISDIDLDMGVHEFELTDAPSAEGLKKLYDFFNEIKIEKVNLFSYWMIYELYPIISTKVLDKVFMVELELDEFIDLTEYSQENDDRLSRDIKLYLSLLTMYANLDGILKTNN